MIPESVRERYESEDRWGSVSYPELVAANSEIVEEKWFGSYQGDLLFLLKRGGKVGILMVGYGSCSGCDEAEACCNLADVEALAERLENSINWYGSWSEAFNWWKDAVAQKTLENRWYFYDDEAMPWLGQELQKLAGVES